MRNALAFGLGTLGRDALAALVSLYLMFYVTEIRGVGGSQLAVLTAVMVGLRIFDAVNDPVMGMIVDRTRTRWGKFKPWMAGGALLWAVAGVLMFADLGASGWGFVIALGLGYLLFEIAYTVNDISYYAMLPALSRDQAQREKIGSVARIAANIGLFSVVVGIVPVTTWLSPRVGGATQAWFVVAVGAALAMLLFQSITLLFAREQDFASASAAGPDQSDSDPSAGLRQLVRAITANDQLLWTTLGMTLFMTGYTLTVSLGIYYFKYVFANEGAYATFALVLGITQLIALALFRVVSRRVSRVTIHLGATVLVCSGYLVFLAADRSMPLVVLSGILLFTGQAAIQLLMVMFIADSVEYGQWKLGTRNESVVFALQPFVYKLSNGLATAGVGATLLMAGLGGGTEVTAATTPASTVWTLKIAMLVVPLLLAASSWVVLRRHYRLDEQTYARIVAELQAREQGSVSTSEPEPEEGHVD